MTDKNLTKKTKTFFILLAGIIIGILTMFLTGNGVFFLHITPVKIKYPEKIEVGIGGSKQILIFFSKSVSLLRWNDIEVEVGVMKNHRLEDLPDTITVNSISSSSYVSPDSGNQVTTISLQTSDTISPGIYLIYLRMSSPFFGEIKTLPVEVVVKASHDDVVFTLNEPQYRGNLEDPNNLGTLPVDQKRVYIGDSSMSLIYRTPIEFVQGGYEKMIVKLDTDNSSSENGYRIDVVCAEDEERFKEAFTISKHKMDSAVDNSSVTTIMSIKNESPWHGTFDCSIEVAGDNMGTISSVPLTFEIVESDDDVIITPGGVSYRHFGLTTVTIP